MSFTSINAARVLPPIILSGLIACAVIAAGLYALAVQVPEDAEAPGMVARLAGNDMCVGIAGLALAAALYALLELAGLNVDRSDAGPFVRFMTGRGDPAPLDGDGMALRAEISDHWETLRARRAMPVTFAVWSLPLLGFIGTVIGISGAIGGLGDVFASVEREAALASVLNALRFAFDTTFIGLVLVIPVMAISMVVRARSDTVRRLLLSRVASSDG